MFHSLLQHCNVESQNVETTKYTSNSSGVLLYKTHNIFTLHHNSGVFLYIKHIFMLRHTIVNRFAVCEQGLIIVAVCFNVPANLTFWSGDGLLASRRMD